MYIYWKNNHGNLKFEKIIFNPNIIQSKIIRKSFLGNTTNRKLKLKTCREENKQAANLRVKLSAALSVNFRQ